MPIKEILSEFLNPLGWFQNIGKSDTEHIRNELQDLLYHTGQSLKSLIELTDILDDIPKDRFGRESYWPIYSHCLGFFVSPDAAKKATTHCTDITRDVARINFKVAKVLRAEWGTWKGINKAFEKLLDADRTFLKQYQNELKNIGEKMEKIWNLIKAGKDEEAWSMYKNLRLELMDERESLRAEADRLSKAEQHIREVLT